MVRVGMILNGRTDLCIFTNVIMNADIYSRDDGLDMYVKLFQDKIGNDSSS